MRHEKIIVNIVVLLHIVVFTNDKYQCNIASVDDNELLIL